MFNTVIIVARIWWMTRHQNVGHMDRPMNVRGGEQGQLNFRILSVYVLNHVSLTTLLNPPSYYYSHNYHQNNTYLIINNYHFKYLLHFIYTKKKLTEIKLVYLKIIWLVVKRPELVTGLLVNDMRWLIKVLDFLLGLGSNPDSMNFLIAIGFF